MEQCEPCGLISRVGPGGAPMDLGCNQERRPKHFELVDATINLLGARLAVQKLCDDICGVKEVPAIKLNEKDKKDPMCLLEVLDYTPSQIQQEVDMILGAVNEIRAQIL